MKQKYVILKDNIAKVAPQFELYSLAQQITHNIHGDEPIDEVIDLLMSKGYIVDTLAHAYMGKFGINAIAVKDKTFNSLNEVVEWAKEKGLSSAKDGVIKANIRKNLSGKTKTAYGQVFEYQKIIINIDKKLKF